MGGSRAGEDGANVGWMEVAPAQAVDGTVELAAAAVERGRHLRMERWRPARRVGAVEHDDGVDAREARRATAAPGKGRNDVILSRPTRSPSSRSSSTTSFTVPAVEPSATIAVVAPSSRYSSTAP